ncbi:aminotransferase class IV [Polaribacter pacificus]|uniref:branched-chain-amino-acid transaminase n=1 Tax=Polaribacter pacificus TaxID=1775173 RepID=A0A917MEN9_9FLAO|nr:aminotransferase class IV [Polaribacter pacificus]GGH03564.1 aminotransferase class IV [Polaribacter pacificus]
MLNFNGTLFQEDTFQITTANRAFKYGDGIFETIAVKNGRIVFWEDHYFRLMASMRMLRMEIPMSFTLEFLEEEILKTLKSNPAFNNARVRLTVFRKDGGLYTPKTNAVDYLVEAGENTYKTKEVYTIDLFKDFYNYSGLLSTVKTTNRMLNTLASVYMQENNLDNCVLINERKSIVEATNAAIFIVKGTQIKTPALTEGCIKGIARKKIIEILTRNPNYTLEETVISPFELQKADEVFIANTIIGVQPVTQYRKKTFDTVISKKIAASYALEMVAASAS